ncbi:uncharacterized protein [Tiliqua scincoides]|uniref:uncharacterized protein n=1 Tax=Tiliqua scincoides TaxID=71010 RepID=UPI003462A4B8
MRTMEASLTCAVCLSLFEEPVTLPLCSHNFCRACLVECLSLTRASAEQPPSSSSSRQASRRHDPPAEDGGQPLPGSAGRASRQGGSGAAVTVSCPLCRKVCPLPRDGGAAALPVNTTLAEVVKLLKAARGPPGEGAAAAEEEDAASALAPQLAALGERCEKHPGRALQLYCRLCCRGGCGQCVSEEHRGIFHSVNLIDTVYQEEKLTFFSNLKKLRTVHLKLMKEITTYSNNEEAVMQNEEEIIKTKFEKICNALETRKKQLLEDLENQRKRKEKECQIWKRVKEVHRKTIENVLNDCENLVDECDPQRFLEVACSLNQRMKTQLDLMQMASCHENQSECKQMQMDTTSVVNNILALKLTAVDLDAVKDVPPGDSEHFVFANTENNWENQKSTPPMAREDAILDNGSITSTQSVLATTESESMSYEELRYNHYLTHRVHSDDLQIRISALNEKLTLPKSLPSSITALEIPLSFLSAEANNQNASKIPASPRQVVNESGFSSSLDFTFSAPAANLNFSVSNNIFNIKKSQKVSKKTSLSEKATNILKPATIPPPRAAMLPFGTQPSLTILSNLPQSASPSATAINFNSSGENAQHPDPSLVFSSSGNLTSCTATKGSAPSFKTDNPFLTLFLEKPEDYNLNSINGYNASTIVSSTTTTTTAAMSFPTASRTIGPGPGSTKGMPCFSVLSTGFQNAPFQTATLNSSQKALFPSIQKEENKATSITKEQNLRHGWFTPPAVSKQLGGNSSCIANVACESASCFEKADTSEKQSVSGSLSPDKCWTSNTPCLFSFKGNIKNSCASYEEKVDPPKSAVSSKNSIPVYKEIKNLISSSSFSSMDKCQTSETESTASSQQNVLHVITPNSALISPNLPEESHFPLEDPPMANDHIGFPTLANGPCCMSNADSDVEDLSQESNSSDSSCTSEYFSVAEDKVLPS